jgi:hypothetical protein
MPPTSVDNHCRRICKWAFVTLKTLYRNIPDHPLSVIPCRTFDPLRCDSEHRRLHRVDIVATWHPFPPDHPSPGYRASLTGAPSSTCATFPQQVTHVSRTTKLLPCTSPVQSVMVVMSSQWGQETFRNRRSWKCGGMASQSSCAAGVNKGCIGWRPLEWEAFSNC